MAFDRLAHDMALAHAIMDQVDHHTRERFLSADLHVESKPDLTLVSDADKTAEQIIRNHLRKSRSRDAVFGEEEGGNTSNHNRRWIIDPIDGTHNFVRGVPVWATLLGLEEDGEMVLGLVSAPALRRRWWAFRNNGAFTGTSYAHSRRIHVSEVSRLSDASLSYSSLIGWVERQQIRQFLRLMDTCWRTRAYGDFWSYMLVAEGAVDIACEPELEVYDMAALVPIVTEAGGRFTSLDGCTGPWGGNALATNGRLHEDVLALLNEEL